MVDADGAAGVASGQFILTDDEMSVTGLVGSSRNLLDSVWHPNPNPNLKHNPVSTRIPNPNLSHVTTLPCDEFTARTAYKCPEIYCTQSPN